MGNRARDTAFAQFVVAHRAELLGVAYLMFSSAERAERVLQAELAQMYASWRPHPDPRQAALREVLTSTPARLVLPGQRHDHFELVDHLPNLAPLSGIVGELADLEDDARRAVILVRFVGLPLVEAAAVLRRPESEARALLVAATANLAERDPVRDGTQLTEQLRAAVGDALRGSEKSGVADLEHGQLLDRRRLLRTGLVAASMVLAVLVGLTQLTSPASRADEPADRAATSAPPVITAPVTPSPQPFCDTRQPSCRAAVLRHWRTEMASLARSYVDPRNDYFIGYSAGNDGRYESALWGGGEGALGLDLSRRPTRATAVYLQVATSSRQAVRCGTLTHERCAPQWFMDGNTFTLTQTTDVRQGLEIQYSPRGDEVITVVARNTSRGRTLDVTRAQLMALVTDPRLRLPPH